jgi:hypothetical protein
MTAQHNQPEDLPADRPTDEQADPIGPITMPKRSRIGSRTLALVGSASVFAIGVIELADTCSTIPTTSVSNR